MQLNDTKIIFKPNEPHIAVHEWDIQYIKQNNITKYITGNLLAKNKEDDTFEYLSWNYFLDYPQIGSKTKDFNIDFINEFNFEYKVLCYNRRPHAHRKILVYNILHNDLLKDNILFSLGYNSEYNKNQNSKVIAGYTENLEEAEKIFTYFTELADSIIFDAEIDLDTDTIGKSFKLKDYQKTFVSLVTETLANSDSLFFSEKTYKPIAAQHPFIILGNPNSLKYLKSIGFKTFDKWWDESYDEETNFKKRFDKILKIIKDICSMSYDELYSIRKEMDSVCIHNYKHFLKSTGITPELRKLGFRPQIFPIINKKII